MVRVESSQKLGKGSVSLGMRMGKREFPKGKEGSIPKREEGLWETTDDPLQECSERLCPGFSDS